jgi:hypothetical protein
MLKLQRRLDSPRAGSCSVADLRRFIDWDEGPKRGGETARWRGWGGGEGEGGGGGGGVTRSDCPCLCLRLNLSASDSV